MKTLIIAAIVVWSINLLFHIASTARTKSKKELVEEMKPILERQGSAGNWDYNEYMRGMYNGMEMMMAIAEERSPKFRDRLEDEENE